MTKALTKWDWVIGAAVLAYVLFLAYTALSAAQSVGGLGSDLTGIAGKIGAGVDASGNDIAAAGEDLSDEYDV